MQVHYKFTGKERDPETGLDEFGARYYSSAMGRFITPDWAAKATAVPYANFGDPQSLNLYAYVENSPIDRIDADGHEQQKKLPTPAPDATHTITVTEVQGQNNNPAGHITIKIDNGPEVGFGPKQDLTKTQIFKEGTGIDKKGTPGQVEPRAANVKTEDQVTIHVTANQANGAQTVINNRTTSPGNYQLKNRNCTEFGEDVIGGAGIHVQHDVTPSGLLKDLRSDQYSGTVPP